MSNFVAGLDLAQSSDYSALVIANHLQQDDGEKESPLIDVFHVRHVQRWRGKGYPPLVDEVCDILRTPPLRGRVSLTVDGTGVGRAVMDLFWQAYRNGKLDRSAWSITITAGHERTGNHVPKKDLVAQLVVLFEQGRLKIAEAVPLARELKAELQDSAAASMPPRMRASRRRWASMTTWSWRWRSAPTTGGWLTSRTASIRTAKSIPGM